MSFNKDRYKKIVETSSLTRVHIDKLWKKLGELAYLSDVICEIDKKDFMLIHRAHYYSNDTKGPYARLYKMVENFSLTVKYLQALGLDDTLNKFLREHDLEVKVTKPIQLFFNERMLNRKVIKDKIKKSLDLDVKDIQKDCKSFIKILLNESHSLQCEICNLADSIKIDTAEIVKTNFDIQRPHFIKAVRIKATEHEMKTVPRKIKSVNKNVNKINADVESINKSVSIFKN